MAKREVSPRGFRHPLLFAIRNTCFFISNPCAHSSSTFLIFSPEFLVYRRGTLKSYWYTIRLLLECSFTNCLPYIAIRCNTTSSNNWTLAYGWIAGSPRLYFLIHHAGGTVSKSIPIVHRLQTNQPKISHCPHISIQFHTTPLHRTIWRSSASTPQYCQIYYHNLKRSPWRWPFNGIATELSILISKNCLFCLPNFSIVKPMLFHLPLVKLFHPIDFCFFFNVPRLSWQFAFGQHLTSPSQTVVHYHSIYYNWFCVGSISGSRLPVPFPPV